MAASHRQKRGSCWWQDKARQRHQDHGNRRRFWIPDAAHIESASPHEVKLVEETIDSCFTEYAPDKIIGDKAYDSDALDQKLLEERDIEMIAPHRKGRKKPKTQDRRKLRPY